MWRVNDVTLICFHFTKKEIGVKEQLFWFIEKGLDVIVWFRSLFNALTIFKN